MQEGRIRPLAICIFSHTGRLLVAEGYDPVKDELFYRPLGGEIEFGEYSQETLVRELREELGVEITGLRYLGTVENVFTYNGAQGHEIVRVYDGAFVDPSIYAREWLEGFEDAGDLTFKAIWKPLAEFEGGQAPPLYPDGLLDLLRRTAGFLV